jgi:hypothetical protein
MRGAGSASSASAMMLISPSSPGRSLGAARLALGGAFARVPEAATPLGRRDAPWFWQAGTAWLADATAPSDDERRARDWLTVRRAMLAPWDDRRERRLVEAFALGEHLDKELFRLSTGTRRKLALVAAFAGGAPVTLLDTPFAALDAPSREALGALLAEVAAHPSRAWVVADFERPEAMAGLQLSAEIDLGD